ncbi:sialyltransferase, partial [Methanobrevibacter sp. OttesenSCG-928-K11]|nr:sialyltransferase [Methanobrevibacter sp. OttesenSCG-928-K11]
MSKTVKEICDFFFNLEDKYSLNFKEIQGTYFWQLIRIYLYYDISKKLNVFESAQQSSLSLFDKIKSFIPFIKNSFLNNPFKGDKKDILIFDHPRKTIFNDKYYDIYSYF